MRFKSPVPLAQVANLIDRVLHENQDFLLKGINEIHKVQEGDLTFVDHPRYYKKALDSAASVVLINKKAVDNPSNKILIYTDDPFMDYNKLVLHFRPIDQIPDASSNPFIDKSSTIFPGVFIGNNVQIGKGCRIHPGVVIYDNTLIGDNVIIHANTVIGGDAFYFQKRENGYNKMANCGRVVIHDKVEIGAGCTIDKGVSGDTIIGAGSKLDNQIHIGHGVVLGKDCLLAAHVGIAGKTVLGDGVIAWGQVGISKGLHIGDGVIILAQSGVKDDLPAGGIFFGSPAIPAREKMKELAAAKHLATLWKNSKK